MFGVFFRGIRILWRLFRSLPRIVQGVLVLLLVLTWILVMIAAYGMATEDRAQNGQNATTSVAPSETAETSPAVSPSAYQQVPGVAWGCLGGSSATDAVFTAQQQAPINAQGAAEFAASYMRWLAHYPHVGDPHSQGARLWTPDATDEVKQGGTWPAGMEETSVSASTSTSRYVVAGFDGRHASVTLSYSVTSTKPTGSSTEQQASALDLTAMDGHWRVADAPDPTLTPSDLSSTGAGYVGGC